MKMHERNSCLILVLVGLVVSLGCSSKPKTHAVKDLPDLAPQDVSLGDAVSDSGSGDWQAEVDQIIPVDPAPFIEQGKYWLINGEPAFAENEFAAALAMDPDNEEAIFGAGLAEYIWAVEMFAMAITEMNQFGSYGADPPRPDARPDNENDLLAAQLHGILLDLRSGFLAAEAYFEMLDDPGFIWDIEQLPIFVYTKPVINLQGRFDLADVYLLRSSNAFFLWFTELLSAQDFHSDLLTAVYAGMKMRDTGIDPVEIIKLASTLIASDQRFFSLYGDDGKELFQAGSKHMVEAGFYLLEGLLLQPETAPDDASQAISVYYSAGNPVLVVRNQVDFHSQVEKAVEITFDQELINLSSDLLDHMQEPGYFVSFAEGPALQLGTVIGFAVKLDLIRFAPFAIPIDLSNLEPAQVVALASMFLSNSVGFDYGTLFANPMGLRSLLPTFAPPGETADTNSLLMEWECPEELAENNGVPAGSAGFICTPEAELVDGAHFSGTDFAMEPDGLPSRLPYLVWEDPTWGGFLGVDELYQENGGNPASFVTPDLELTNLGIHLLLKNLLGLL
jgi:hypothetical protein